MRMTARREQHREELLRRECTQSADKTTADAEQALHWQKLSDRHHRHERHIHLDAHDQRIPATSLIVSHQIRAFPALQRRHALYLPSSSRSQQNDVHVQETATRPQDDRRERRIGMRKISAYPASSHMEDTSRTRCSYPTRAPKTASRAAAQG
ncbi:hypothetical protein B0H10DRAFT_2238956 [Mycena sp. CBHHK59/15]|nr:hypothetical protein B0H10DRAFT_2238956 [Mycena sp. CBHHK59/15]